MSKYGSIAVIALFAGIVSVGGASGALGDLVNIDASQHLQTQGQSDGIEFDDYVTVQKNGEQVSERHNVLMEGEAVITHILTTNDDSDWNIISVGNSSDPTDTDGSLPGRLTTNGFSPKEGTISYGTNNQSYTIEATYTATASQEVCTTALEIQSNRYNSAGYSDIDTFAGTGFGRCIPFEKDDQLTVTWEIVPQNP